MTPSPAQPPATPGGWLSRFNARLAWPQPLMALVSLTTLLAAGWLLEQYREGVAQAAREHLTAVAEQRRDAVEQNLASLRREAELFASSTVHIAGEMADWIEGGYQDRALEQDLVRHFRERVEADSQLTIVLYDAAGQVRLQVGNTPAGNGAERMPDMMAGAGVRLIDRLDLPAEAAGIGYLAPIRVKGQPRGGLLLMQGAGPTIYPLLGAWPHATRTRETYLMRRDGSAWRALTPLRFAVSGADPARLPPELAPVGLLQAHFSADVPDYRGKPAMSYVTPVRGTDWLLVAQQDRQEIFAETRRVTWVVAPLLLLVLSLIHSLVYLLQRTHAQRQEQDRQDQDRRLAQIARSLNIVLWEADPATGAVHILSDSVSELTGYPVDAYARLADHIQRIHPDDRALFETAVSQARPNEPVRTEYRTQTADGRWIWLEDRFQLSQDADGQPLVRGIARDITERKAIESSLEQSRKRYGEMVERIPVGVYTLYFTARDVSLRFEYLSDRACEIIGVPKAEALRDAHAAFGRALPEDLVRLQAANWQAAMTGEPFQFEGRFWVRDTVRWLRLDSRPTFLPNGDSEWSGVIQDITEFQEAQAALQREIENRRAREADIQILSRQFAALSQVNQTLLRGRSRLQVFEDICRIQVETGQVAMAWVGVINPNTRRVDPAASFGDDTGYLTGIQIYADERPEGRGPTGTSLREDHPVIVPDFEQDPSTLPWRRAAHAAGWACSASLPLHLDGRVYGALTLYGRKPGTFTPEVVALIRQSAANIDFALDAMATAERRNQAELEVARAASRYERMLETSKDAFWLVEAATGRLLDVNATALRMTGFTREELLSRRVSDIDVDLDQGGYAEKTARVTEAGGAVFEARHLRQDGTIIDVEVSTVPDAQTGTMVSFIRDITARKAAEKAIRELNTELEQRVEARTADLVQRSRELRDSEERFRLAMEATSDGLWDWNLVTGEVFYSSGYARMFGYEPEEWAPRVDVWLDLMHPDDRDTILAREKALLESVGIFELEFRMRAKDGHYVWVLSRGKTVERDESGQPVRVIGTIVDLTERKTAELTLRDSESRYRRLSDTLEQKVNERTHQLARALAAKSQFLANMSHEIRTPMNAVLGLAQLLEREALEPGQAAMVRHIREAGDALLVIINDILDLSKIESGQLALEQRPFAIGAVLERLENLFRFPAEHKGIGFATRVGPNVPEAVMGDDLRLGQILTNLCGNAVKFTEHGAVEVVVKAEFREERRVHLRFEVRDTGIGIADDQLANLFQPFTQADESITRRFGGTGLGLNISKRLIELMDGRIGAESTPGEGSTFWIELPLPVLDPAAVAEAETAAEDAGSRRMRLTGLRALVVDDNAMNRLLIEQALLAEGAHVALAENGQSALDVLQSAPRAFDVVLMDVQMPVMDGMSATRAIRANPALHHLPVIAFTAGVLPEEREAALAAGVDDFLAKPVNLEAMAQLLAPFRNPGGGQDSFVGPLPLIEPLSDKERMSNEVMNTMTSGAGDALAALESLPGIQFGAVLELVGGDREMLGQLLAGFLEEFAGLMDEADVALAAGEREALTKRMHTLKGTAANLGLQELSTQAAAMEMALKQQQPTEAPLDTLRQSFDRLLPLLRAVGQPG